MMKESNSLGIIPMNNLSTKNGGSGRLEGGEINVPNLLKHESGSLTCSLALPTGESVLHVDAADLTRTRRSFAGGRHSRSVRQQSSSSFQTSSERPRPCAFVGFEGLIPPKTLITISGPDSLPNGIIPVSTCKVWVNASLGRILRGKHLVYHHRHRIYVGFLRGYALVESKSGRNKELRCHESCSPPA